MSKELVETFAKALACGQFPQAAAMLCKNLRGALAAELLEEKYTEMIEYGDGPANHVELMKYESDWPLRRLGDIAWAYVAISGHGFSEAITVVVANEGSLSCIESLEWGRP